jgi:tripartite-type tricarboxylate transporter receptor subunit TctC
MRSIVGVVACGAFALGTPAHAQDFPKGTIRIIVPNAITEWDYNAALRVIDKMSALLGQKLVLMSMPGGQGRRGINECTNSNADGYVVCELTFGHLVVLAADSLAAGDPSPYDPAAQLTPIGKIAEGQYLLVIRQGLPVHSVAELAEYAKNHPLSYATHGPSSVLIGKMLEASLGVKLTLVPYVANGEGGAKLDMEAGRVDLNVGAISSLEGLISQKVLRPLGVFGGNGRSPFYPKVPTLHEQGIVGMDIIRSWNSFWAPAGTPPAVVQKLSDALKSALGDMETIAAFSQMRIQPGSGDPEELRTLVGDMPRLARFMREHQIRLFDK